LSGPCRSPAEGGSLLRRRFLGELGFDPDPFQVEAFDALDRGRSVLVSAPTGSGKTLVAAFAIRRALAAGGKAFYTSPLKALSNQKLEELGREHGHERVGLLTGDVAVRASAPVVVMTTEVLRNMLLAGSELLDGLHTVVLDEVHYLQDPYRGGVWEEVLVLCPPEVVFVCLSATVSNAHELGEWLSAVRGPTEVVVEVRRPVLLRHHFAIEHRQGSGGHPEGGTDLVPLIDDGRPGAEGLRADQTLRRLARSRPPASRRRSPGTSPTPWLPFRTPRRTEIIEALEDRHMLPAIVFIFSRAACDDAVRQCVRAGVRLTDGRTRTAIRRIAEHYTEDLSDADLEVLGYGEWVEGLGAGVAAHHAGLVPAFRQTVEACFAAGLLQVVFATETLSVGINMPARTVVIERFDKFGGAGRATLTSGEYAQMTGRAGRRGLDHEGHAVVLWSADIAFVDMARVAQAPPPALRSSFRPTYNLAVNLVHRFDRPTAHEVLNRSFAQWQHRQSEGLVEHLGRRLAVLEELECIDGWSLTDAGLRLSRVYHECDLLIAEAVVSDALVGSEPSVMAGVLSAVTFERRRARRILGYGGRHQPRRGRVRGDRVGERRQSELSERLAVLDRAATRIRAVEEVHLVPRTRAPEPGLAVPLTAWARGADFATVIELAARHVGEVAPGDFVRTVKQVADLAGQVAAVAPDPATAASARALVGALLRDVVAAGQFGPAASATSGEPTPSLSEACSPTSPNPSPQQKRPSSDAT